MENKENKKGNVFVFSQNDTPPKFADSGKKGYIPYGTDNLYPEFLQDLLDNSALHNSIVIRTSEMVSGGGFVKNPALDTFIENPFGKETLDEITNKLAYDLTYLNMFTYLITWSKDKTKIVRITFIPAASVRLMSPVDAKKDPIIFEHQQDGVEYFQVSPDWENTRKEVNKPVIFQGFSEKYKENTTQLVRVMVYRPGSQFYTLPSYVGGIAEIQNDIEIAKYNLNNTENSFSPSFLMTVMGSPSEEEEIKQSRALKTQLAGAQGAGKVLLTFADDATQAPVLTPIEGNTSADKYIALVNELTTKVILAHRANSVIAGLERPGGLASSTEVEEQTKLYQKTVVAPKQGLIEKSFNQLLSINGVEEKIELVDTTDDFMGDTEETDNTEIINE